MADNSIKTNKQALKTDIHELFKMFEDDMFKTGGKLDHLFMSGIIDFSEPQPNYVPAKQLLLVIGQELEHQYRPPTNLDTRGFKKTVKSLYQHM